MKVLILSMLLLAGFAVEANECLELTKCIEHISKLTGKKYIYDAREVKGGLQSSANFEITPANADTMFTYILEMNGFSRIPTAEKDTYSIIASRDIRYQTLPMIKVDAVTPPVVPNNNDYYMMAYKYKHFKDGQTRMAANGMRPFMSRYARVIETGDTATIQEVASKLQVAYEMFKNTDRELTKEEIKTLKENAEERKEERKMKKRVEIKVKEEKK